MIYNNNKELIKLKKCMCKSHIIRMNILKIKVFIFNIKVMWKVNINYLKKHIIKL